MGQEDEGLPDGLDDNLEHRRWVEENAEWLRTVERHCRLTAELRQLIKEQADRDATFHRHMEALNGNPHRHPR